MTAAAVYLRISQDATGEQAGVTRQQEDCLKLVEQQGWSIHQVYTDNDISAYKSRPGYQKMLTDIKAGHVGAVVAWAPDRLYRRIADLETLIEVIEGNGVQLRTVKAGDLDLTSAYGRMIARILGSVASGEGEIKAERWKRSWQQRREAGQRVRTGSRMFGYTDHGDVIDHEAAVARVMAAKIREGGSILGVCRWLDEQGVRATRGSAWTPQSVKRYLTNPRLAGFSTLNGEVVAEGQWEPILDRDTFETVRAMLTARTRAYVPRKALLLGLIHCGKCGHRLITSGAKKGGRNYRCPKRPGMDGCGRISGQAEAIEEYVEGLAEQLLDDPRVRERIAHLSALPAELLTEVTALDLRIRELEAQLDEPGVPVEAIIRAIGRAKDRRVELDERLAASAGANALPPQGAPWPDDLPRRRRLVDLVVERIELKPADLSKPRGFDPGRVKVTLRD